MTKARSNATAPAAKGEIVAGTGSELSGILSVGANGTVLTADSTQATGLRWGSPSVSLNAAFAQVAAQENTTSTTFTDLTTFGPSVTLTTGTRALVIFGASTRSTIANAQAQMGFAVSGATTRAVQTNEWVQTGFNSGNAAYNIGINEVTSGAIVVTGLTAGSNTFTAKYCASGGDNVQYQFRKITVIDLGS